MKIIQIVSTLSFGDAVGNDVLAFQKKLRTMGYQSEIYAEIIDMRMPKGTALLVEKLPRLTKEDIVIYHLSTGCAMNYQLEKLGARKILVYHNITPPHYYHMYSEAAEKLCEEGLKGAKHLAGHVDYCLAVSEFNKQNLIDMGYQCSIDVLPILIPFEDYQKAPRQETIARYSDGWTNILFTGRIAPNKKQEDVIRAFHLYKKYYNPKSRLILVGSHTGMDRYYARLKSYVNALDIRDSVIFPGHIKFDEILAYYKLADLFLCQSEHEGFCVPLVEAMYFGIPIVAYDSSAISETLDGCGIVLKEKNALETAGVMNKVLTDDRIKNELMRREQRRIEALAYENVASQLERYLNKFI